MAADTTGHQHFDAGGLLAAELTETTTAQPERVLSAEDIARLLGDKPNEEGE